MSAISTESIKKLRELTNVGMMDCKRALEENGGDFEKAVAYLRKKGAATAEKRAGKVANQGLVESYIHFGGRIGAMVELNCETDFVAKTADFKSLVHDLAMQIAAMNPKYVTRDQIDKALIDRELDVYKSQALNDGKDAETAQQLAEAKIEKWIQELVLFEQSCIKDSGKTIKDLMDEMTAKVGEKVVIRRYIRYELGEEPPKG
jgi:elongation factor Ts